MSWWHRFQFPLKQSYGASRTAAVCLSTAHMAKFVLRKYSCMLSKYSLFYEEYNFLRILQIKVLKTWLSATSYCLTPSYHKPLCSLADNSGHLGSSLFNLTWKADYQNRDRYLFNYIPALPQHSHPFAAPVQAMRHPIHQQGLVQNCEAGGQHSGWLNVHQGIPTRERWHQVLVENQVTMPDGTSLS